MVQLVGIGKYNTKTITFKNEYSKESYEKSFAELNNEYKEIYRVNKDGSKDILKAKSEVGQLFP